MPYTEAQYAALVQLLAVLIAAYPSLSSEHLVGHSDIAPGRKSDPALPSNWPRLRAQLRARLGASP